MNLKQLIRINQLNSNEFNTFLVVKGINYQISN